MDHLWAFDVEPALRNEDDWTEEDEAEFDDLLREIQAEERPEEGSEEDDDEDEQS
jgi:hypothetical protein